MSTLGNIGAVAGGILGGMNIKQAMEKQKLEEERLRQEMKWRREDREYQKADRARAEKERTDRDAFYSGLGSAQFAQPGAGATLNAEVVGLNDPRGPGAPDRTDPTEGVPDSAMGPARSVPGMATAFPKAKPKAFDYNVIDQDMQTLNGFQAQAYKLRDQGALSMVEGKKKEIYARYLSMFDGDPMKDPAGFAQHAAKVSARFGSPLTPEQAFKYAKASKAYEQEGALDALKLANSGNKEAALKAYNSTGNHKFADLELTPAKSAYGINSFNIVGVKADGSKENIGNAMDAMIGLMTGAEQANLAMKKLETDDRIATREANRADKAADNAHAEKQLAITERHYRNQDAAAFARAKGGPDGLTTPQQRTNAAISAARRQLAGMTETDVLRKTQAYTATGRENPEHDPQLAATVRLARSRMYGDDPAHDAFAARGQAKHQATATDSPRTRFEADPQMAGHKLGKPTGQGWEVIGPDGKLAGYWN